MIPKEEISNIDLKNIIESETGLKFNRDNKICCPLQGEKTPSFTIKKYDDKYRYHCFGCGRHGDVIDFIKEYKNITYIEACKHLNIEPSKEYIEKNSFAEMVEKTIKKINFKDNEGNPLKYVCLYIFVNRYNDPIYFKAKFKDKSNKSTSRYFSINDNKVVCERGSDEVPYNLYSLMEGLKNNKDIFILEGEKDVDTLSYMGYIATSFKGITKFDYSIFNSKKVYVIPDTGKAGEKYRDEVYYNLKDYVKEFNVIDPEGLSELGDNKDITDWFKSGKTLEDFKIALRDKWDYKKSRLWRDITVKVKGDEEIIIPKKTWRNVENLLKYEKTEIKYNLINKGIEATGKISTMENELIVDVKTLCCLYGLNMNRDDVADSLLKISRKHKYNPFIDYIKDNRNSNHEIIEDVFNCLVLNDPNNYRNTYLMYFTKWLLNVVRMANNTIQKGWQSEGVLVLQGKQGCRKSTFCQKLISNNNWFKGGNEAKPSEKDSVKQNTKYILVELGEFDSTLKGDQAKLKAFFTQTSDEYRAPYARCEEIYPRITSFCATVNRKDFLKDETGSRRFWVIPIERCDIDALQKININEFWGAVYDLCLSETMIHYLNAEETEILINRNVEFNIENDISIAINEKFDFEQNPIAWKVYSITELLRILDIKESKALKNELERRCYKYAAHRDNYSNKPKKGFKLPNVNIQDAQRLERDLINNPFEKIKEL